MVRGRGYLKRHRRPRKDRRQDRTAARRCCSRTSPASRSARRAPRHRRAQRRGRGRERHRPAALRRQCADRHRQRQGSPQGDRAVAARGHRGGAGLRPLGADPPRDRHAEVDAVRGKRRRRAGVHHLPAARAQRARRHPHAARRHPDVVHRHEAARHRLQHHEPRRHRHRHRRDDRRGHRHDRERTQASGARAARQAAHRDPDRGGIRGRPGAVLLAAHHHRVVPADLHAGIAGRPAVRPTRLHQDVRDGGGGDSCR